MQAIYDSVAMCAIMYSLLICVVLFVVVLYWEVKSEKEKRREYLERMPKAGKNYTSKVNRKLMSDEMVDYIERHS